MKVIENTESFNPQRCVATIGKFDGVHLGHQLILRQLKEKAAAFKLPSLVILIEPHPEEFFASEPHDCPARLTELEEKLALLEDQGVDFVFKLGFDEALCNLSAEEYIESILVEGLGIAGLIVGSDFRFGHRRRGDFQMLQRFGRCCGFEVIESDSYSCHGVRVSSTYIREQLHKGDFALAEELLGRPYSISGTVVKGQNLGKELGFPTCNVRLSRKNIPLHGVYACEVQLQGRSCEGVANIGYRPTISSSGDAILEVHLFDFDRDLYGKKIAVVFRYKIREEEKFDSLAALKERIAVDVCEAKQYFANKQPASRGIR